MNKRLLIVSNGPVPPMKHAKIEGGGQRCWGLATGLHEHGLDVTVAVRDTYPLKDSSFPGIKLTNWSPGKQLASLANKFDAVIISYSMGRVAADLARSISDSVTFTLDCYVPIYIEISARKSQNLAQDYPNYMVDVNYFNTALKRGDYFLYANEPQKHLYTGVLAALGLINPFTYGTGTKRLLQVPFGMDSDKPEITHNPYRKLGIKKDDFILLWFGGLYPWYDIKPLLESVSKAGTKTNKIHLVIVGAKSPYNRSPEFTKPYDDALAYAKKHKLQDNTVHFVDWVDFNERINWYRHADAAISITDPGEENVYSWRTRIMDHVWGEVPLITNGGDPLCELLLSRDAAIRLPTLSEADIVSTLKYVSSDKKVLQEVRHNLSDIRPAFFWGQAVRPIVESLKARARPTSQERAFRRSIGYSITRTKLNTTKPGRIVQAPLRIAHKVRTKGVKGTAAAIHARIKGRISQ